MWADVPEGYRWVWPEEQKTGRTSTGLRDANRCRAAVQIGGTLWLRRCDSPAKQDGLCFPHAVSAGLIATRTPGELLLSRVILNLRRSFRRPDSLRAFRALSDDDILKLRYVGTKMAALVREMRDTWTDERLCAAMRWQLSARPVATPEQVEAFFATRPDVFAVLGG